jgi:inorganic pyrophosphatase
MTDIDHGELRNSFDYDDDENKALEDHDNEKKYRSKDPIAEKLIAAYKIWTASAMLPIRLAVYISPIVSFIAFSTLVSNSTSCLIAVFALLCSISFLGISMYILCEILLKDCGTKEMQDVSDPIREGSEGFFMTQYGTIFKFAYFTTFLIYLTYAMREPVANSQLNDYFSVNGMAIMTSFSFLIGAHCSAIAGYAGIWVSVRANIRCAAAARKCYNEAIVICFRGGAFAAIINVALAIFGISFMYLVLNFYFYLYAPANVTNYPIEEIPVLLVGFGFGASFVAMFA